ncbi:MAG: hypothetical protein K2M43_02250 [Mycoplasmoidaceae bacterium]|nr:hypothetical protein [Mycoplasmoidaceae bacterium]
MQLSRKDAEIYRFSNILISYNADYTLQELTREVHDNEDSFTCGDMGVKTISEILDNVTLDYNQDLITSALKSLSIFYDDFEYGPSYSAFKCTFNATDVFESAPTESNDITDESDIEGQVVVEYNYDDSNGK